MTEVLPKRWTPLRPIDVQIQAYRGTHRFNTFPCGRRSGKTELIGKRRLIHRALRGSDYPTPRFFAAAPTRDQAKRIFWSDLKALVAPEWRATEPSESELIIRLANGAEIHVLGLDKPERIEGVGWDGGVLDEYANMKPTVWQEHIRPALSDRNGWCDFTGVPEGRNHYYDLDQYAKAQMLAHGPESEWGSYHWVSALVLPEGEIEAARRHMDALTFAQEYEASFINFQGQAYYAYCEEHLRTDFEYNPREPLIFCFDFNVSPGVAVVCQELADPATGAEVTVVIGEVHIPRNSNTIAVCNRLISDWANHEGIVYIYGDATGGARGTAKTSGSDWDIVQSELGQFFDAYMRVPRANPSERSRVNAVNTRLVDGEGEINLYVNPDAAPNLHKDLEGVRVLEGGSGEIDKRFDPRLSHASDALGYYIVAEHPIDAPEKISSWDLDEI